LKSKLGETVEAMKDGEIQNNPRAGKMQSEMQYVCGKSVDSRQFEKEKHSWSF
jgi:hypothetical protein